MADYPDPMPEPFRDLHQLRADTNVPLLLSKFASVQTQLKRSELECAALQLKIKEDKRFFDKTLNNHKLSISMREAQIRDLEYLVNEKRATLRRVLTFWVITLILWGITLYGRF